MLPSSRRSFARTSFAGQDVYWLGLGAFVLGCAHGLKLAHWQVVIEGAQVLAGLVEYPAHSPQGVYHLKLWTALNQVSALFLYAGITEKTLSIAISAVGGGVFYLGVSLTAFSVSRNLFVSLVAPMLVIWTGVVGAAGGITYPVILINSVHTYGSFGLSAAMIVVGLVGCNHLRSAAIVLGIMPALHPSWGVWMNLVLLISVSLQANRLQDLLKKSAPWLLFGYALSSASLLIWFVHQGQVEEQLVSGVATEVSTFMERWDGHRRSFELADLDPTLGANFYFALLFSLYAICWLILFRGKEDASLELMYMALTLSTAGSIATWLFVSGNSGPLAEFLLRLMPQRWLNLTLLAFLPILIGGLRWSGGKVSKLKMALPLIATVVVFRKFDQYLPQALLWYMLCLVGFLGLVGRLKGRGNVSSLEISVLSVLLLIVPFAIGLPIGADLFQEPRALLFAGAVFGIGNLLACRYFAQVTSRVRVTRGWALITSILILLYISQLVWGGDLDYRAPVKNLPSTLLVIVLIMIVGLANYSVVRQQIQNEGLWLDTWKLRRCFYLIDWCLSSKVPSITLFLGVLIFLTFKISAMPPWESSRLEGPLKNSVWQEMRKRQGLVLTGSNLYLVQLRSRRPILFDGGAINWLPYVPSVANSVKEILDEIYGVDVNDPSLTFNGRLDRDTGKDVWQERDRSEWQKIGAKFDIEDVLVYSDWKLDLPLVKRGEEYALYRITGNH